MIVVNVLGILFLVMVAVLFAANVYHYRGLSWLTDRPKRRPQPPQPRQHQNPPKKKRKRKRKKTRRQEVVHLNAALREKNRFIQRLLRRWRRRG